jgi:hypothetical protein
MVAWYYIDKHSCIAVFIGAFHFDGEKHDAKFKTDSTQSKLNNYQKINYIQSTFGKRFSTERGGHLFETQFHTSTSMIQISPQPSLRLVGNKSNINYFKERQVWKAFLSVLILNVSINYCLIISFTYHSLSCFSSV